MYTVTELSPNDLWTDGNYYVRNSNTPFGNHGFMRVYSSGDLHVQEFIPFDRSAGSYAIRHKNYNVATDWVYLASRDDLTNIAPLNSQHVDHINHSTLDKVNIVLWDQTTIDTPFKTGQTIYGNGFCLTLTTGSQVANDQWVCQLAMAVGDSHLFTRHCRGGAWSGWTAIGSPAI